MESTSGVLFIHSAPSALCRHVQWAVAGVLGARVELAWLPQPVEAGTYRAEMPWHADVGTAARLTSALQGWARLRFEVTEDPTRTSDGERYCATPSLGVFHATTGANGDIHIPEALIKQAIVAEALGGETILTSLDRLLGRAWDDELEPFRQAEEVEPARWLHAVV